MLEAETLTDYRRRLRVLVEDLSLCGIAKELKEILSVWKRGLKPWLKEWLFYIERAFPEPGTAIEVIYRLERFVIKRGGGLEIDDIVFMVSTQSPRPAPPDFRIWEYAGGNQIYAHDIRNDHLGVRDADPFSDDYMMDYIIRSQFPREVLLTRPPIVPEYESTHLCQNDSYGNVMQGVVPPVPSPPQEEERGSRKRSAASAGIEEMEEKIKQIKKESTIYAQQMGNTIDFAHQTLGHQYGVWKGTPHGGWISEEDAAPIPEERPVPATPGVKIGTSDPRPALPLPEEPIESESDSNSIDHYPQLAPGDKGKGHLYPSP